MSTVTINVNVTGKHVLNGECSDTRQCAIAQALLEAGFKNVSVGAGENSARATLYQKARMSVHDIVYGKRTIVSLGNESLAFINAFDELEDAHPEARERMVKKYDAQPLVLTINLDKATAQTVLRKTAYDAAIAQSN